MEITYDTGAKVILQGPVTYEVESTDGGFLSLGKLTARLEKEGRGSEGAPKLQIAIHISNPSIPHPSSLVYCPHSHRHRDRPGHGVRRRGEQGGAHHVARLPRLGQAASGCRRRKDGRRCPSLARERVGPRGESRQSERRQSHRDARSVRQTGQLRPRDSQTNDQDVRPGRRGGRRRRLLRPAERGHRSDQRPGNRYARPKDRPATVVGDGKYHRVEGLPFVDGVFIPDGRAGPVQVDSAGHTFAEFPKHRQSRRPTTSGRAARFHHT